MKFILLWTAVITGLNAKDINFNIQLLGLNPENQNVNNSLIEVLKKLTGQIKSFLDPLKSLLGFEKRNSVNLGREYLKKYAVVLKKYSSEDLKQLLANINKAVKNYFNNNGLENNVGSTFKDLTRVRPAVFKTRVERFFEDEDPDFGVLILSSNVTNNLNEDLLQNILQILTDFPETSQDLDGVVKDVLDVITSENDQDFKEFQDIINKVSAFRVTMNDQDENNAEEGLMGIVENEAQNIMEDQAKM